MNSVRRVSRIGFILVTLSVLIAVSLGTAHGDPLFQHPREGNLSIPTAVPDPETVLRQRIVDIRHHAMDGCGTEVLELNLFDDVDVIAVLDRTERGPSGGCAWIGTVVEPEAGQATLVMRRGRLSGTITLEDRIYHVRPMETGHHLVREVEKAALEMELGMDYLATLPEEQQVVTLVNQERSLQGLHPLIEDSRLSSAARGHSEDMASKNYFSHTSEDGRSPWDRIADVGYHCGSCGENIAAGYSTPAAVMNGWMTSSGHRANILSASYCDIGVGYGYDGSSSYGHYWTQDFGREQGVTGCSAVVNHYITATASSGGNISPPGQVTVPEGGNQAFSITPDPGFVIADVLVDGASVGKPKTYTFSGVTVNHTIEAHFHVRDASKPTVSVTASDSNAAEFPANHGRFQVTRTGDVGSSLVVFYSVRGTATAGTDYKTLSGRVTIPSGSSAATIRVIPYDDPDTEGRETVVLTIRPRSTYNVGSPSRAKVIIRASD